MLPNPQETADLVTFTEEILNGKLHFLGSIVLVECNKHYAKILTKIKRKKTRYKEVSAISFLFKVSI